METIKLEWLENTKTSTGKDKINATITKADGTKMENVTIWGDFPNWAVLKPGETIQAKLVPKDYNGRTYYSLAHEQSTTGQTGGNKGTFGGGMGAKLMEKKSEGIAKAQEHKDLGIMTSSTLRMAVDLTVASMRNDTILQNATEADIKGMIKTWREWLIANWELDVTSKAPF